MLTEAVERSARFEGQRYTQSGIPLGLFEQWRTVGEQQGNGCFGFVDSETDAGCGPDVGVSGPSGANLHQPRFCDDGRVVISRTSGRAETNMDDSILPGLDDEKAAVRLRTEDGSQVFPLPD